MTAYLFDFDGTIANSFLVACDIILKQAAYLGCKQLTSLEVMNLKEMHAREMLAFLQVPFWRVFSFVRKLRKLANERADEMIIFPEWEIVLRMLKEHKHVIGIVSSNSREMIEGILKKYNLYEVFDFIFCDVSLFGKKRCLNKIIIRQCLDRHDTCYIGDEVRDIEAAQANKIRAIAVAWGFNSIDRLKLAKPEQLIININELKELLIL